MVADTRENHQPQMGKHHSVTMSQTQVPGVTSEGHIPMYLLINTHVKIVWLEYWKPLITQPCRPKSDWMYTVCKGRKVMRKAWQMMVYIKGTFLISPFRILFLFQHLFCHCYKSHLIFMWFSIVSWTRLMAIHFHFQVFNMYNCWTV